MHVIILIILNMMLLKANLCQPELFKNNMNVFPNQNQGWVLLYSCAGKGGHNNLKYPV